MLDLIHPHPKLIRIANVQERDDNAEGPSIVVMGHGPRLAGRALIWGAMAVRSTMNDDDNTSGGFRRVSFAPSAGPKDHTVREAHQA